MTCSDLFRTFEGMARNNSGVTGPVSAGLADPDLISVTYATAAEITGLSVKALQRAVRAGDLVPRYPTARPLLLVADLRAYVEAAPCEPNAA